MSYQIDKPVTALVIDARAASVAITVGDGPVTVTEEHRYSRSKPTTAHAGRGSDVTAHRVRLRGRQRRCDVGYRIRMPKAMSAEITAQAGAVKVDGLAGDLQVTTQAGAVEGRALTSDQVTIKTAAGAASLEFAAGADAGPGHDQRGCGRTPRPRHHRLRSRRPDLGRRSQRRRRQEPRVEAPHRSTHRRRRREDRTAAVNALRPDLVRPSPTMPASSTNSPPPRLLRRVGRWLLIGLAVLICLVGTGMLYQAIGTAVDRRTFAPPRD